MAVEMFLDIDGVKGESQADKFKDKIDIFSYSLGANNVSSVGLGSGSGAGKVSFTSINVSKQVDNASPTLMLACCQGKHFNKAKLTVREAGGDNPVDYLIMDFEQVFVDNIQWSGSEGAGKPNESVSFSFAKIEVQYFPQKADGSKGAMNKTGWDVKKNTKL